MLAGRFPVRALGLALLVVLGACGRRSGQGVGPGVLVVVVDGLRADHLDSYGYDRETSPQLSALARRGLRFERVYASAPLLIPAHVALLTGCEPSLARRFFAPEFEGLNERRWLIPERVPRLAVEFLAAGYSTVAFLDNERIAESAGFRRGFQRYSILDPESAEPWEKNQTTRVILHFLQWLRALPADQPWFAYVELNQLQRFWAEPASDVGGFFQPRAGLSEVPPVANTDSVFFAIPRSRWRGGMPRSLGQYEAEYDDEIRRLDAELQRLFATLRSIGRDASTSIHVLGSFGTQLGEAGMYLTSGRYSTADLGVPWIFRPRADQGATLGATVSGLASTLDVAPTLLALEGLEVPSSMHGVSQAVLGPMPQAADRSFVFASCGLQEGCAVIGERYALEYLLPLGTDDAQLRRSWVGAWSELAMQPRLMFYDRLMQPYPPLEAEGPPENETDYASFRGAAVDWLREMNEARSFYQHPEGAAVLDPAVLERLRQRGHERTPRAKGEAKDGAQ